MRPATQPSFAPLTAGNPDPLTQFGYQPTLPRTLRTRDLAFYGLIFMVPIAPFGIFGSVFSVSGGMVALAYAVGLVAMLFTASSYAQMVKAFPMAGSVYSYAGRAIAAAVGFLAGWTILLDYFLVPGLLALVAAVAMNAVTPAVPVWAWIAVFVLGTTAVNLRGMRLTAAMVRIFLIGELVVLAVFLMVGVAAIVAGKGNGLPAKAAWFDSAALSWTVVAAAVSVAMLSFLGFDAISLLAEDNKGAPNQIGRAMFAALVLAGALFIVQTWVAALLVPRPGALVADGDPAGTAFYDAARVAAPWLGALTAVATALAWGVANTLVAQVATTRLLFAMGRDRQLPAFLAKVSLRRAVPVNAYLVVAALSLGLGLYMASRDDGIGLLASMVNFGALVAFITLHVSVIWHYLVRGRDRGRERSLWSHLFVPLVGIGLLVLVAINANVMAQRVALIWMGVGVVILGGLYATGRRPRLAGQGR
ncbi:APC family permease [Krasilnikovia sp. MM14-A1259]|uniref:APC family permease n=1 Tax=Krasilnikovia sp. MM14-A1259 TaxID=3373539 RepID=UPI0037FE6836